MKTNDDLRRVGNEDRGGFKVIGRGRDRRGFKVGQQLRQTRI